MKHFMLALMISLPALADEIQTKDGKKIEFKTITDGGDVLEVTTPQGTQVTVKKADFDRLILSGAKETPLTGAAFSFDKKRKLETVDLFTKIDPKKDALSGAWRFAGGALVGPGQIGKLQTSHTPPEEYDLTLTVERKEGNGDLGVGMIGGGRQFSFHFDWGNSPMTGFSRVNGQSFIGHGMLISGRFFEPRKPRTITFMVRKEVFIVQADGKDFFTWRADWPKVEVDNYWTVNNKGVLFLTGGDGTFTITKMTLAAPKQ
jgi:hypothetical protein